MWEPRLKCKNSCRDNGYFLAFRLNAAATAAFLNLLSAAIALALASRLALALLAFSCLALMFHSVSLFELFERLPAFFRRLSYAASLA